MRLADITTPIEKTAFLRTGFKGLWEVAKKVGGGLGKDVKFAGKVTKGLSSATSKVGKAAAGGVKGIYHAASAPSRAFKKMKMTQYDPKTRTHKTPNPRFTGKNKATTTGGIEGEFRKLEGKRQFVPKYETKKATRADLARHTIGKAGQAATHPLLMGFGAAGVGAEGMKQRQYPTGPSFLT